MAEEEKVETAKEAPETEQPEAAPEAAPQTEQPKEETKKEKKKRKTEREELETLRQQLGEEKDKYLRLAAEYDNYRKRSQKEKDHIYSDGVADTLTKFLPVYDNLERAMQQATADEAYKKGVEMTMTQLKEVLTKLGIEEIPALGEPFDPNLHNAVMHVEDEGAGENTIVDVFQTGFKSGDKVVRFAMVKVAN